MSAVTDRPTYRPPLVAAYTIARALQSPAPTHPRRRKARHRSDQEVTTMGNLPAPIRHLILLVAALGLSWGATDVVPWLSGQTGYGALLAGLLAAVLAVLTPLVQSYGLGKRSDYTRAA